MAAREPKGNGCRWRCPTMNRRRETTAFNRYHHPIPNITTTLERRKAKTVFSPCYDGISGISSFFCPLSRVSHGNVLPFKILSIRRYQSEWLPARYDDGYLPKKIGYKWAARNRRSRELFPKIWAHHHSYVTLSFRPIFFLPCVQNTYWYCGVSIRPLFL